MPFPLRLERTFRASPAEVFRAWTNAGAVRIWFAFRAAAHWEGPPRLDPRPGGDFDWTVTKDDPPHEVFHFRGTYREVEAAAKLVFTWNWESLPIDGIPGPGRTIVTVQFVAAGSGARIVLTHAGLPGQAARDAHERGWARCLDGIAAVVESQ